MVLFALSLCIDDLLSENLTTPTSEFDAPATFPAADEGMNSDPESGDQKTRTVEANRVTRCHDASREVSWCW